MDDDLLIIKDAIKLKSITLRQEFVTKKLVAYPDWLSWAETLTRMVQHMKGPICAYPEKDKNSLTISFILAPGFKQQFATWVPFKHTTIVLRSIDKTVEDYIPVEEIRKFIGGGITIPAINQLNQIIANHQKKMMMHGAPNPLELLKVRLGIR